MASGAQVDKQLLLIRHKVTENLNFSKDSKKHAIVTSHV